MSYVYIDSQPGLLTVGFYDPDGKWHAESDHSSTDAAAQRVRHLNGGNDGLADLHKALRAFMALDPTFTSADRQDIEAAAAQGDKMAAAVLLGRDALAKVGGHV